MIGQTISHYKILAKLGAGGMGVVYKAQDTTLNRAVALKFLPQDLTRDQETIDRFINEAQAASALDHANICTIHEIGETEDGQMFIVMAYYAGETLQKKVVSVQLSVDSVIDIVMQVARGLERAHEAGITHRDIKPSNLVITPRGEVKIIDFGLAKLVGQTRLTKTGATVGTVAYMSPEQIQHLDTDHPAQRDIWALGVVLYEMLTGKLPFRGDYEAAMLYSIVNEKPEPVQKYRPELAQEFLHVLNRALEKNPADRYQSVSDMLIDLRRLKSHTAGESTEDRPRPSSGERKISEAPAAVQARRPSKKKLWMSLGAVAVLAIIATVLLLLRERRPDPNPNMTFRALPIPFNDIRSPGLSQDGNWVAFPAADANGKWEVYLMNTSGGEPRRITSSDSSLVEIIQTDISPDGSQIVYCPYNRKLLKHEIHIISTLGGLSKRIVEGGMVPRWRPDGQRIGYILGSYTSLASKSGKKEFWSVKPDGNDNRLEFVDSLGIKEGGWSFSWSPDAQAVAWLRGFPEGYYEIIVRELATGKERQLTFDQKHIEDICWTHRREIIFSSDKAGNYNLWMAPVAGGQAIQITKGTGGEGGTQISTNGKKLLYYASDFIGHLWIANSDGSGARQITFDERWRYAPSFSPDGRRLLFRMYDPSLSTSHIYLMGRDGSNRQQLSFGNEWVGYSKWSPDGQWIAYSSQPSYTPIDSGSVYLLAASNPVAPRLLGKGADIWWINPKTLVVSRQFKNWLFSIDGAPPQKFYDDSTRAYPILEEKYVLFKDFRKGREGWWIVPIASLNSPSTGLPRKILSKGSLVTVARHGKLLLYYATNAGEIRKISLPNGKDELFPVQLSDWQFQLGVDISYDGKEIVYVEPRNRAKLVMIENLFK